MWIFSCSREEGSSPDRCLVQGSTVFDLRLTFHQKLWKHGKNGTTSLKLLGGAGGEHCQHSILYQVKISFSLLSFLEIIADKEKLRIHHYQTCIIRYYTILRGL